MDAVRNVSKNKKELERIFSQDIGMGFGIDKCGMSKANNEEGKKERKKERKKEKKRNRTTQSGKYQKAWRKRKLEIPGNIRSRYYKTQMKEKVRKKNLRRIRKLLKNKQHCRNLIKRMNT